MQTVWQNVWLLTGRAAFFVTYPLLAVYLNLSERSRVVISCRGEVLLVKSWVGNGQWDLPGGGLHRGEAPAIGASRELAEELSLIVEPARLKTIKSDIFRSGLIRYRAHYLGLELAEKPQLYLQKHEVTAARWIAVGDLSNIKLHPALKEAVVSIKKPSGVL